MASAKKEAQKYLGKIEDYIDLKGLNKERDIANQVYNTNRTTFQNAYDDLLNTIASNRQKARTDFGSGRSTISENAYMRNRESANDLASRGLGGGIAELSKLGNRMETGRQYSNLANTFYNTMNELDATQRTGENEYNTNMETAQNTLQAALADIGAREAAGRNAYKAQVAQLAEQIQARRDAAAAAAAQNRLLAQQIADAKKDQDRIFKAKLYDLAGDNPTEESYKAAMKYYQQNRGGSDAKAAKYLNSIGIGRSSVGAYGPQTPWTSTNKSSGSNSLIDSISRLTNYQTPSTYLTSKLMDLWR